MDYLRYLSRRISLQKGIGEKHAQRLTRYFTRQKKQQDTEATLKDLLFHIPYDYVDRRHVTPLGMAREGVRTIRVRVLKHLSARHQRRARPVPYKVQCEDDTGSVLLVFFRGDSRYLQQQLPVGGEVIISGQLQRYDGMWQMTHPDLIVPPEQSEQICRLDPVYPSTEGISSRMLSRWIQAVLEGVPPVPEWLAESTVRHHGWVGFDASLRQVHHPDSEEVHAIARQRLAYDEALSHQLSLVLLRRQQKQQPGVSIPVLTNDIEDTIAALPFALTEGQREVLQEMDHDMRSGERMLRLLQGDVGAGKTVVAALAILATVKAGHQAALMAPTEILARQHLQSMDALLGVLDVPVIFLAGSLTPRQREEAREQLRIHPAAIVVGTHALFQEGVEFANLALVVIDEQHRFGVNQRLALSEKGLAGQAFQPHMLLMTATPIPRSLQMTYYGDMDVSLLKQKPAGRQPIDTRTIAFGKLEALLEGVGRALANGEKVYWICPLVEEMETPENPMMAGLQAAESRYGALEVLFSGKVGLVHGRMSMQEREPVMQAFKRGDVRILVATTVVEVGVDVPDATIMVIENAERFGLAQLHQLRGRVGRGDKPSRCLLLYQERCSETARQRLKTMRDTNDGFVIAEMDLKLRGAGDVLGTRQTGLPDFTFLDMEKDTELFRSARKEAALALENDPALSGERGQRLQGLLRLFELDASMRLVRSG